jgi:thymidylate kinase
LALARPMRLIATMFSSHRMTWELVRALLTSERSRAERWFAFRHATVTADTMRGVRKHGRAGGVTVFHEGMCQRAFLAFVDRTSTPDPEHVQRFLRGGPQPDIIVLLRVDPDEALRRVRSRGHGALSYRFDGLSDDQLRERLTLGGSMLLEAARTLQRGSSGRVRVIELTGGIDAGTISGILRIAGHLEADS